jgi:hypothetical protein
LLFNIFLDGQTGAGKTYTMGTSSDFDQGVMPSALREIFQQRDEKIQSKEVGIKIELSYLEIYLEECYDLLSKEMVSNQSSSGSLEKKVLNLRETNNGETYLDGLNTLPINNIQEVANYLTIANRVRSTGKTAMNSASSRSHAICIITVTTRNKQTGTTFVSKLNLVDLAGSERAKKTQATGEVFQEGISINKGLLALGNVVAALSQKSAALLNPPTTNNKDQQQQQHIHIPYRESKLTRLLKDSLGGNGFTVLLACLSPSHLNYDESLNTLRFASRASSIINNAKVNNLQSNPTTHSGLEAMMKEFSSMKEEYSLLQEKYNALLLSNLERQQQEEKEKDPLLLAAAGNNTSFASTASSMTAVSVGNNHHGDNSSASREMMISYYSVILKFILSIKNLLTYCFSEDLYLEENELLSLSNELKDIRNLFNIDYQRSSLLSPSSIAGNDENQKEIMELLKNFDTEECNILNIIDELKFLENHFMENQMKLIQQLKGTAGNATVAPRPSFASSEEITDSARKESKQKLMMIEGGSAEEEQENELMDLSHIHNTSDHRLSHSFELNASREEELALEKPEEQNIIENEIYENEEKLSHLLLLTEEYQTTIKSLQKDIETLETDKQKIQQKQQKGVSSSHSTGFRSTFSTSNSSSSSASAHQQLLWKNELKQKQVLLDEKMKTLKEKEKELVKINQNKQSLIQKMDFLNEKLLYYKTNQVVIMKKLHEKEVFLQQTKKDFVKQENQLNKQLNQRNINIMKLSNQLSMKEKNYQNSLQKKEKEMNWLKDLLLLKEKKAAKENNSGNTNNNSGNSEAPMARKGGVFFPSKTSATAKPTANSNSNPNGSTATFQKQFHSFLNESLSTESKRISSKSLLSHHLEKKCALQKLKTNLENLLKSAFLQNNNKKLLLTRNSMKKQFYLQQKISFVGEQLKEKADFIKSLQSLNCLHLQQQQSSSSQDTSLLQWLEDHNNNNNSNSGSSNSNHQLKQCIQKLYSMLLVNIQEKEKMSLELNEMKEKEKKFQSFFLQTSEKDKKNRNQKKEENNDELFSLLFGGEDFQIKSMNDLERLYSLSNRNNNNSRNDYNSFEEENDENEIYGNEDDEEEQELDETFYCEEEEADAFDEEDDDDERPNKRRNKSKNNNSNKGRKNRKNPFNSSAEESGLNNSEKKRKLNNEEEESEDPLEDSFSSSDDENDSDSSSLYPKRKNSKNQKKPAATTTTKRKTIVIESDLSLSANEEEEDEPAPVKKPRTKRASIVLPDHVMTSENYEKWNKMTVKQLKVELSSRGLTVSGKKTKTTPPVPLLR